MYEGSVDDWYKGIKFESFDSAPIMHVPNLIKINLLYLIFIYYLIY